MSTPSDYPSREVVVATDTAYTSFWPVTLLGLSILIILGWELSVAGQLRSNGEKIRDQQAKSVEQSKQVQLSLEKLARDLVELSQSDEDAKTIVKKYGIAVNATGAPGAAPAASPAASATP